MYSLSYAPPTLATGESYPVIATFPTYDQVVEAVGQIEQYDLSSVYQGHYEIAGAQVACYVCGTMMEPNPYGEACYPCMNPEMPVEVGSYTDGYGNDYGWQDSTFPNEY